MIDEHARELIPNGTLHQCGRNSRINPAGQAADDEPIAHLLANEIDLVLDHTGHRPRGLDLRDVAEERLEHSLPMLAVQDLGMELHAGEAAIEILHGGDRSARGAGGHRESLRSTGDRVTVRHPHRLSLRQTGEEAPSRTSHRQLRAAELAASGPLDDPTKRLGHSLEAVADPEHRYASVEKCGVHRWGPLGVHTGRPSRQHDGDRLPGEHLCHGHVVRNDLGVGVSLPNTAGNQLRILRPEVDNEDGTIPGSLGHAGSVVSGWRRR